MITIAPELWLPVVGFEQFYEVSNLGRVRVLDRRVRACRGSTRVRRGHVVTPIKGKDGYLIVRLHGLHKTTHAAVHRLVAKHFLTGGWDCEVNHRDFNKTNNAVANLEWLSREANQQHARLAGRFTAIVSPKIAKKLTPEKVLAIRLARKNGATYAAIAKLFCIRDCTAWQVATRKTWKGVVEPTKEADK